MKRRIVILGGGTFQPVRNHLALAAPAFGSTAKDLKRLHIQDAELFLTKMAHSKSKLVTNEDVERCIDELLEDKTVGTIILNVAFCDFKAKPIDGIENDFHGERLETSKGDLTLELTPTEKIIKKIRIKRPDIFLVGFKTTTNKTSDEQFLIGLKMMKSVKCNLVLANDTVTRNNMIITAEETIYGETTDRAAVLKELAEMTLMRCDLTYNPSEFIQSSSVDIKTTPKAFQKCIQFLIDNDGFIENNSKLTEEQIKANEFVEKFRVKYDLGATVLNELFLLNKDETKLKIQSICGDKLPNGFIDNSHVIKVSEDDKPERIELVFYDRIIITWQGIDFHPNNGKVRELIQFNEHFKL